MLGLALRGMAARKLRTALTAMSIVLGVAMISGTYVLTDTMNASFERIFQEGAKGVDVKILPKETVGAVDGDISQATRLEPSLLERVRQVEGVDLAVGEIFGTASILGKDGKPMSTNGAPTLLTSTVPEDKRFNPLTYTTGRAPAAAGEVALDAPTVEKEGFRIGDRVRVAGAADARAYALTGIARYGEGGSLGGASIAVLTLPEAQRVVDAGGRFDDILIGAEPGTSAAELKKSVATALGSDFSVQTGEEDAASQAGEVAEGLGFLTTALLAFAGIALFVGAFTIFNTFSITVAQRTREFALLRTLGASRRQILTSVVVEALAIGLGAALVGLVAGLGFAEGVNALFKALGIDLPKDGSVIRTRTVVVSLVVGIGVTVLAALLPALRATRVAPVVALREGAVLPPGRGARLVLPLGVLLALGGGAVLGVALFADVGGAGSVLPLLGLGAALLFLGVTLLSPRLVRPIAYVVGKPLERARGLVGRLARENTMRNTGRTAVTAAALMIGLALVTFVTIFAAGTKASVTRIVDEGLRGDLVVLHTDGFSPIPLGTSGAVAGADGVETVSNLRLSAANVRGIEGTTSASGIDPRTVTGVLDLKWVDGSDATARGMAATDALVNKDWAETNGVRTGERLAMSTPSGERVTYTVRGVIDQANLLSPVIVGNAAIERDFGERQLFAAVATVGDGQEPAAVASRVDRALASGFPTADAQSREEYREQQAGSADQLLGLIYALLSLAVVVSLFGIVNTLALSILERTRELGMLRAVGMSRRQMRTMVRYEAVITALIGAVLGTAIGVFFALIVGRALEEDGFVISLPVISLFVFLMLAALAGIAAAILPARRAARMDVLRALAYE